MLTKVIQEICKDVEKIVEAHLVSLDLRDSNLYKSLEVRSKGNGDFIVEFLLNDYVYYVENGRRSGKMPPFEKIRDWCERRGIPSDNRTVWAIRQKIARDGIKPRPFIDRLFEDVDKKMNDAWANAIFEEIITNVTNFFK